MHKTQDNNNAKYILDKLVEIAKPKGYSVHNREIFYSRNKGPTILITAGIHGNEKAGPYAIYSYIKKHTPPYNLNLFLMPIINQHGFNNNNRENKQGRDLNRAFNKNIENDETDRLEKLIDKISPDLVVNLHEDNTHDGCYIYIPYEDMRKDAEMILKNVEKIMPRCKDDSIFGDVSDDGIILQSECKPKPKNHNSFEYYCYAKNIPYMTFETCGKEDIKKRAAAMLLMMYTLFGETP
jgi:predicted deacylase